jgi:hypothetical protein
MIGCIELRLGWLIATLAGNCHFRFRPNMIRGFGPSVCGDQKESNVGEVVGVAVDPHGAKIGVRAFTLANDSGQFA